MKVLVVPMWLQSSGTESVRWNARDCSSIKAVLSCVGCKNVQDTTQVMVTLSAVLLPAAGESAARLTYWLNGNQRRECW
jgi:hypothetical protein